MKKKKMRRRRIGHALSYGLITHGHLTLETMWLPSSSLWRFLGPENKQSLFDYFWPQKLTFFGDFWGQKLILFEDFWLIFLEPETDKFWRCLEPETDTF